MAYTKMWAIKERLDTVINYIENEEKTIDKALNYVTRNIATENQKYVTCINCSASNPYESMYNTKKLFHDQKKRIAFHAVQSFLPGEGDADTIHEIGVKLAKELYGDEYEIVVTTHLDKDHLHNHILINSTSFVDGHHFTNLKADRKKMVEVSDRLCKEYRLNVIENTNSKSKNHNPFKAKSYIRDIKKSMNDITQYARTMIQFIQYMELEGYEFKSIDDVDCIIHPGFIQPIPLSILGKNYSLDSINDRILEAENFGKEKQFYSKEEVNNLYYKFKNHQLKGILFIYVDFQIKLGIIPGQRLKGKQKLSKECRKQLKKLDLITYETTLMDKYNIRFLDELTELKQQLQQDYDSTIKIKNQLYQKGYHNHNLVEGSKQIEESKSYQPKINELRKQIKALEDIETRSLTIHEITIQVKEKQQVR